MLFHLLLTSLLDKDLVHRNQQKEKTMSFMNPLSSPWTRRQRVQQGDKGERFVFMHGYNR
jgi:hypothetical protein